MVIELYWKSYIIQSKENFFLTYNCLPYHYNNYYNDLDDSDKRIKNIYDAFDIDRNNNHIMSSRLRNWGWDDDLGLYVFVDNSRYVLPKGVFK